MLKARDIIFRAYKEVVQSKSEPNDGDYADGLRYLNRMMSKLEIKGIILGYTPLTSIDQDVTVPATCFHGMIKNLAVNLWPQYSSIAVNPILKFSADRSFKMMQSQAISVVEPAQFPSTIPIGSGNYCGPDEYDFYRNRTSVSKYIQSEDNNNA
jgi:hypothetical protein